MNVCITSQGNNLDSQSDPKFGRCEYFLFVDMDTMEYEAVENENKTGERGVGIQSGQFVAEKGVDAVLTGSVGPKAAQVLESAGIKMVTSVSGSVREVIESFKNKKSNE